MALNTWQPPSGYIACASAVEGITVYAPKPKDTSQPDSVIFKCPQCGANTRYDITAGGVACEHCGYLAAPKVKPVGRGADEFEFTLETYETARKGWGVDRRELHCESCGASLALSEGTIATACSFCASSQVILRPSTVDSLRPRFVIPFKIEPETIRARTAEWLGKGWYHPDDLSRSAVLDHLQGVYLPFWTFDADIAAHWRAEVGHARQERHYSAHQKRWTTRTVIDWRWEDGLVNLSLDDWLIPGSTHASRTILSRLMPFDLKALMTYLPDYLAGWQAQSYDVTLPQAWEEGKTLMREHAKGACYKDIASAHIRNFSMTADFAEETWRYILLPVYLAAYQFEGKTFQIMGNGQNGLVAGQKPVAWWKIWLAIAVLLAPGGVFELISLPLLLAGGIGMVTALIGAVLLVIGGLLSIRLFQQARASEAA